MEKEGIAKAEGMVYILIRYQDWGSVWHGAISRNHRWGFCSNVSWL